MTLVRTLTPDYGAQFLLLDLTHTPAHALRQEAATLAAPHARGRQPDAGESHVSVMTLPSPALPRGQGALEQPSAAASQAFRVVAGLGPPRLAVAPGVAYLQGPRSGPPAFTVAYLPVDDAAGDLGQARLSAAQAAGAPSASTAPLHLTLANLPLGERLPPHVEAAIRAMAESLPGAAMGEWVLSGRHGAVFARA